MGLYAGIFLVTLSGLMFEIGLTRIFSATIWYHFAFVAISVALLGWGLGGFALHLARGRVAFTRERAAALTLLYGLSIPVALWLMVRVPFHPDRLGLYFAVSLAPFLLAGMALSMLFAIERANVGPALLRRPARRLARSALRHLPADLARRGERGPAGLAGADRRRGGVLAEAARRLRRRGAGRAGRLRREHPHRLLQHPQRPDQGPLPPHGGDARRAHRADRLERLLADRRRHRRRGAVRGAALHRLGRLDGRPRLGREARERPGAAQLVPRDPVPCRPARAEDPDHRPRRRLGRARRARGRLARRWPPSR